MKLTILGAGAWGTAFALTMRESHAVTLWSWEKPHCEAMRSARENNAFLPGFPLPDDIRIEDDFAAALHGAELAIIATPMAGLRATLQQLAATGACPVVWLCKGFESGTSCFPHQVAEQTLPNATLRGALSGPSFADEIARGLPAAVALASPDRAFAESTARALHGGRLRIYSNEDLIGVEVGGAVKNVMAIAAGVCDGLGLGLSARAALITRGLAEITRLGVHLGGKLETFMGLAGAGDLVLTCTGDLSRNRRVGLALAKGHSLDQILKDLGHIAEGVPTAREVKQLAQQSGVDMPITSAVCDLLDGKLVARDAVDLLLRRDPKAEN